MDQLLIDNPKLCEYAVRDAVITLAYWMGIHVITQERIGPLFKSISVGYLTAYLKSQGPEGLLWPPQTTKRPLWPKRMRAFRSSLIRR